MPFLGLMLRGGLRHRWRSWLVLSLLTALDGGPRPRRGTDGAAHRVGVPALRGGPRLRRLRLRIDPMHDAASLPGVASMTLDRGVISASPRCACRQVNTNDFSINEVPSLQLAHMVKLVSGRMPNQSDPSEVLASSTLEPYGIHVGSVLHLSLVGVPKGCRPQHHQQHHAARSAGDRARGRDVRLGDRIPLRVEPVLYDLYTTQAFDKQVRLSLDAAL